MRYRVFSEADMINKSRDLIHAFMTRQMIPFAGLLDENFVWIGDYSSQYIQGKAAFLKTITTEIQMPPLELSEEEYTVLTHERHTWIIYGRCTITTNLGTQDVLSSGIHFTFVWKQIQNDMYLCLASASHVQDEQLQNLVSSTSGGSSATVPQARVFNQINADTLVHKGTSKIRIRDLAGNLHFLYPDEIVYANSKAKNCTIHTISGAELISCMPLNALEQTGFLRIHSRYLVNRSFVASIRRHKVKLTDNTILPVGKQRYNAIVRLLETS